MMDKKAFTLMELITVTIIVGVTAAFAIPSYSRAIEKSHSRQVKINLLTIHAAGEIYKIKNQDYPAGSVYGIDAINSLFNIKISDPYFDYNIGFNTSTYTAQAHRVGDWRKYYYWEFRSDEPIQNLYPPNPFCQSSKCPHYMATP
ncbi:MAG: prepilin-type N-terminal cleavage/methylation domain-containing protein [Candidatus Omnitrophica bacterium]|nr:prepilin-type N-terminal cleavage/methylation domain-containing protein [Candidatus Omnitrophota bacterium]